jgi:hypothetical protein
VESSVSLDLQWSAADRKTMIVVRKLVPIVALVALAACSSSKTSTTSDTTVVKAPESTVSAADKDRYCTAAKATLTATESFNAALASPGVTDVKAAYEGYVAALEKLIAEAPAQLAADLTLTSTALKGLAPILAANNYNLVAALSGPDAQALFTTDVTDASKRINAFNETECGITPADNSSATTVAPTTSS